MLVLQKLRRYTMAVYEDAIKIFICLNNLRIITIVDYKRRYAILDMKIMNYYTLEYSSHSLTDVTIIYRCNKKMYAVRMSDTEISVSKTTSLQESYGYYRMYKK